MVKARAVFSFVLVLILSSCQAAYIIEMRNVPTHVRIVSAGGNHTAAIDFEGRLWAWGYNVHGQLGNSSWASRYIPSRIGMATDWVSVSAGGSHTAAVREDGSLWTWGWNGHGQLGDGTWTSRHAPVRILPNITWASVSSGERHTAAIDESGRLWVWGSNSHSQIGTGSSSPLNINNPTHIMPGTTWLSVSSGERHTAAIREDRTLWVWGYGGLVGDNTTVTRNAPVQIMSGTRWLSVSSGERHTAAIREDRTLWVWGENLRQLGLGTAVTWSPRIPLQITQPSRQWESVSSSGRHSIATGVDGSLWVWGWNDRGQLGEGVDLIWTNRLSPVQIQPLRRWVLVSAGQDYSTAISTDGSLWAWGCNSHGQLGNGTTNLHGLPVRITR